MSFQKVKNENNTTAIDIQMLRTSKESNSTDSPNNDTFIKKLNETLNNKIVNFEHNKNNHIKSKNKHMKLYYIFSNLSSVLSVITSFLVGYSTFENLSPTIVISLVSSLGVSICSAFLTTSNISKKIEDNIEAKNKYSEMISKIRKFNCQRNVNYEECINFLDKIQELEDLLRGYTNESCCFN